MSENLTYDDKEFESLKSLAKYLGIKPSTLSSRIDRGWPKKRWGEKLAGALEQAKLTHSPLFV